MLGDGRRRQKQILRQLVHVGDIRLRCNQPTQSPTGHAEVLGETVHYKNFIRDSQGRAGLAAVDQTVVDLIHNQAATPGRGNGVVFTQGLLAQQSASRI